MKKRLSRDLHLHLKFIHFDAIERGEKLEEYRGLHWLKHLTNRHYDRVFLWRGYEPGRFLVRPWRGFVRKVITHPEFDNVPTEVLAIALTPVAADRGDEFSIATAETFVCNF
jgi:hypothetical protein